jgi:hypothetical protein
MNEELKLDLFKIKNTFEDEKQGFGKKPTLCLILVFRIEIDGV